ncbi:MAG: phosphoribosylanthranilate isomerase [Ignavibacteriae bacterium]|nr:phosphoribosylanthranilate isomerase [Ignavibacteriota bacterium]NOG99567.1 phosphoribosylanthranilate isomerase [Ignavibacteriota bacterium]
MKINFNKFIQIAGVIDKEEAELLINCGAEYLGFPLRLPVNKEDHTEEEAAEIIAGIGQRAVPILITYLNEHKKIIEFAAKLNVKCVQLHGTVSPVEVEHLKKEAPEISVIKSLIVRKDNLEELKEETILLEPFADAFITDTFDPQTGAEGATGKTHNWEISREIVNTAKRPVILAGGLNPSNVKDAILKVKPAGVDVHTGVENSDGRKNKILVDEFIRNADEAFAMIENEN